jgi:hypothetical protein
MKHKITFVIFSLFLISTISFAQKTIEAENILNDIKNGKSISYENATIVGSLDFTYMKEALKKLPSKNKKSWWGNNGNSDNKIEKLIDVKISFVNCTFKEDVLAYIPHEESGYTFTASFEDVAVFKACMFEAKAMFKYSNFDRNTDFSGSTFKEDNTFKYARFNKNIDFSNTTFDKTATFKYAKFRKNVNFSNSLFKDTAIFKYTSFNDGVSFKNTNFEEDLNIKYMNVSGNFDISNMKVEYDIDSKYTKINGSSFSNYLLDHK